MLDTIGQNVRALREARAWTQEQLAAVASVTARTIQRIESGQVPPSAETLMALASALEVDLETLRRKPEEHAKLQAEAMEAYKKAKERYVIVHLEMMERASHLAALFGTECMRCDHVVLSNDAEEDAVSEFEGCLRDCLDVWDVCESGSRRETERSLQRVMEHLLSLGLVVAAGTDQRRLVQRGNPGTALSFTTLYVMVSRASEPKRFAVYDKTASVSFQ